MNSRPKATLRLTNKTKAYHFNKPREAKISEYHLYLINDLGHVRGRFVLQCRSDDDALSMVERHRDGRDMELWQGERLVRRLPQAKADAA